MIDHFRQNSLIYSGCAVVLLIGALIRSALVAYGFDSGTDYYSEEFQVFWMPLLYTELTVLGGGGLAVCLYLWFTRPGDQKLTAETELGLYWRLLGVFAILSVWAGVIAATLVESDAAWHQVTIRDTDFTPTHILIFYFALPALTAVLVPTFIWVHTRIPAYRNKISIPLLGVTVGILMIMPNYGFNEWGHTFFYAEELFAAPIHWGFVFLGWSLFFLIPLAVQLFTNMARLIAKVADNQTMPVDSSYNLRANYD